jgi:hypothetical protein
MEFSLDKICCRASHRKMTRRYGPDEFVPNRCFWDFLFMYSCPKDDASLNDVSRPLGGGGGEGRDFGDRRSGILDSVYVSG